MKDSISIKWLQEYIKKKDNNPELKQGYFLKLVEEMGELSEVIRKNKRLCTAGDIKGTIEEELYDVITLKLDTEKYQEDILDKRLDIGRRIYNACLNELGKRYRLMIESKEYQRTIKIPKNDENRNLVLQELNKKYRLTEYSLHDFVKRMQHHFSKDLDSFTVQKIATRCFKAFKG